MSSETIELSGHIIDSWTLPRAWDVIMDRGGNFTVEEMRIGIHKTEPSYTRMRVEAPDDHTLELILTELQQFGAILVDGDDAQTMAVEQAGGLAPRLFLTDHPPNHLRAHGQLGPGGRIETDMSG